MRAASTFGIFSNDFCATASWLKPAGGVCNLNKVLVCAIFNPKEFVNIYSKNMLKLFVFITFGIFSVFAVDDPRSLEEFAAQFDSSMRKNGHNFVSTYETYFHGIRDKVQNVLQVGHDIHEIKPSLQVWHKYFNQAKIYGLGNADSNGHIASHDPNKHIHISKCNIYDEESINSLNYHVVEMDIVFDSVKHERKDQELLLPLLWDKVKPGGFYIIEYLHPDFGGFDYELHPEELKTFTLSVLHDNLVQFVDTHLGHPDFESVQKMHESGPKKWRSHRIHDAFLLIIRKRVGRVPPIKLNTFQMAYRYFAAATEEDLDNPKKVPEFIEYLSYKYGSDKSHDDHKYTDVYAPLFDNIRHSIVNVTEVGVAYGASIQIWHDYFPNANIFGFDVYWRPKVLKNLALLKRAHSLNADAYVPEAPSKNGFALESMDLIVDDAHHERVWIDKLLEIWWPILRPGGLYVIEDAYPHGGSIDYEENPSALPAAVQHIFANNDVLYIDAMVGSRTFDINKEKHDRAKEKDIYIDRRMQYSYLIVIRKRH